MKNINLKRLVLSVCLSIFVILLSYFVGNTSYPMAGEKTALVKLNNWKSYLNLTHDSLPDDVLLINVAYDKALTTYWEGGMEMGQIPITDRKKLLDFLSKAHKSDCYKFIMMDVIFEHGIETEYDSALFHTIASMPRIVIPVHSDTPLHDSILYSKAANADYNITHNETNFVRFQFAHDGVPSMPLKIYEAMTGKTINRHGYFYSCDGQLCSNAITLKLPIKISGAYLDKGETDSNMRERSYLYLGADLLSVDSIISVEDQIRDKIIVIGDFNNDRHRTYLGFQPGSVICLNAYYALLRGEHFINFPFIILLFFIYLTIAMLMLNGRSVDSFFKNPWMKAMASFFALTVVFTIISMIVYALPIGIVYNPVMPTTVFAFFGIILNAIKKVKQ